MSMCVRNTLETFIRSQRARLSDWLSKLKREAIVNLESDKILTITQLEGTINTMMPLISNYTTPDQYIQALKSHSLVLSFLVVMLENIPLDNPNDVLNKYQKLVSILKSGTSLDFGGIISESRASLNELGDIGEKIYIEGARRYLSTIIETCGFRDLMKSELFLLTDAINSFIVYSEKPYVTLEEIGVKMGVKEKRVREIVKKISEENPEIISKNNLVTTVAKIEKWVEHARGGIESVEDFNTLKQHFPRELEKAYIRSVSKTTKKIMKMLEEI